MKLKYKHLEKNPNCVGHGVTRKMVLRVNRLFFTAGFPGLPRGLFEAEPHRARRWQRPLNS
jgi:hypothetical protein